MTQAVPDQDALQPQYLRPAPDQHDRPGVEQVDQQGQPGRPQQEEERGEEQAVAGIVKDLEDASVQLLQRRGLAHQAIPAVPSDADQVENGGDTQSGAVGQPG